jgi:hypothetical protein
MYSTCISKYSFYYIRTFKRNCCSAHSYTPTVTHNSNKMEPERTSGQSSGEPHRGAWSSQKSKPVGQSEFGQAGKRQKVSIAHQHVFMGTYASKHCTAWLLQLRLYVTVRLKHFLIRCFIKTNIVATKNILVLYCWKSQHFQTTLISRISPKTECLGAGAIQRGIKKIHGGLEEYK